MSSSYEVIVSLPPEGTLARSLTLSFMTGLASASGCSITCDRETARLSFKSEDEWRVAASSFLDAADRLLEVKRERLRCPQLHYNDYANVFNALLKGKVSKTSSYIDAFIAMLRDPSQRSLLTDPRTGAEHLSSVRLSQRTLTLGAAGERSYALIQPFRVETYEYGSSFHSAYRLKLEVRTTAPWLLALGAGFAFSYAGMMPEGMFFVTPDEDSLTDISTTRVSTAIEVASTLLNVPADPALPYLTYIALNIPELISKTKSSEILSAPLEKVLIDYLLSDESVKNLEERPIPRIKIHKILAAVRAYTLLLKESADISQLVRFAFKLDKVSDGSECREYIASDVVRPALGGRNPRYLSLVTHLYEAVHGAEDPYSSTYYIVRELSSWGYRMKPRFVRSIIRALEEL
ncbi:MAG: hypothetical protein N3H31_05995 [Candidatus Nezhaarchaeota archaeon]|nr:hypothetical protein [Candidatus Nezhaarchaeota archaeon]